LPIDAETDGGLEYAVNLYYAGRWMEAGERLRRLARNDPDDYRALGYLGLVALQAGDAEEVADLDSRLAEVELPEWRLGANTVFRARIAAAQGEIERAVDLLEQALAEGYRQPAELRAAVAREFSPYLEYPRYRDFLRPGTGGMQACDGGPAEGEESIRSGGSLP
jgi:Flp pilus assembly protein TadD